MQAHHGKGVQLAVLQELAAGCVNSLASDLAASHAGEPGDSQLAISNRQAVVGEIRRKHRQYPLDRETAMELGMADMIRENRVEVAESLDDRLQFRGKVRERFLQSGNPGLLEARVDNHRT